MKNEDLCELIFRKTLLLEGELKFAKENPQNCPPPEKKGKKKKSKTPQM